MFIRMPPWCDLTLYDTAAKNILDGGVHYRDIFDTNPPGFVWALTLIRMAFGWSIEAVRCVDLGIICMIAILADRLAAWSGASKSARAWAACGASLFYPFTAEVNHCQRDVWMMLPALVAVVLRFRHTASDLPTSPTQRFFQAFLEGAIWGLAVWIKPHAIVPAFCIWLGTTLYARGRNIGCDLLGNLAGGLMVGTAGVLYMIFTGTWQFYVDVITFWNTGYAEQIWEGLPFRPCLQFLYFPPWSYLNILGIPMAILSIANAKGVNSSSERRGVLDAIVPKWIWKRSEGDSSRLAALMSACLYLGWTLQALLFQNQFHYVHVPETLLVFTVIATYRLPAMQIVIVWLAITTTLTARGAIEEEKADPGNISSDRAWVWYIRHPISDVERVKAWPSCFRMDLDIREHRARWNALAMVRDFHAENDWVQLGEVEDFLRAQSVKDREVLCWHDSPHALYLALNIRPAFRFLHVDQASGMVRDADPVWDETMRAIPHVRFIVSDLLHVEDRLEVLNESGPNLLPECMPEDLRCTFPFTRRAIFRSGGGVGRYVVHTVERI